MPWPSWLWKRRPRSVKSDNADMLCGDPSAGPATNAEIEYLDALLAKHGHELYSAAASFTPAAVAGAASDEPLADFGLPYKTERLIGEGATGQVFKAADLEFSRSVAIKVSRPGHGEDEAIVYRTLLAREQRHLGPLVHESVVHVYRTGRLPDGRLWYAMEYIDGETITDYIVSQELSLPCSMSLLATVAAGVGQLHKQGVMHADLKPAHILVTTRGQPKVIDFGMARMIGPEVDSAATSSSTSGYGSCVGGGTPGYRAPELACGQLGDFRSDVYSLGVIMYELIAGRLPEQSHDIQSDLSENCQTQDSDSRSFCETLPAELDAVVGKCMAASPNDRYPNATFLAAELSRWLENRPVAAFESKLSPRRVFAYRAAKLVRRYRTSVAVVGLVACLVATALGLALQMTNTAAKDQTLIAHERQRATSEKHRADTESERVETQQYREAIVAARELLAQRRINDAGRALFARAIRAAWDRVRHSNTVTFRVSRSHQDRRVA